MDLTGAGNPCGASSKGKIRPIENRNWTAKTILEMLESNGEDGIAKAGFEWRKFSNASAS
jgi:hypothetical protein